MVLRQLGRLQRLLLLLPLRALLLLLRALLLCNLLLLLLAAAAALAGGGGARRPRLLLRCGRLFFRGRLCSGTLGGVGRLAGCCRMLRCCGRSLLLGCLACWLAAVAACWRRRQRPRCKPPLLSPLPDPLLLLHARAQLRDCLDGRQWAQAGRAREARHPETAGG